MATVITRSIASTPKRTATETWEVILLLLAPDAKSAGHLELKKITGVAASSIASEATTNDAFIIYGNGPQVRVYCIFGDDAISGDGVNEDPFHEPPVRGDWKMSIPCIPEDVKWSEKKLKEITTRVTARATGETVDKEASNGPKDQLAINTAEFLKP